MSRMWRIIYVGQIGKSRKSVKEAEVEGEIHSAMYGVLYVRTPTSRVELEN